MGLWVPRSGLVWRATSHGAVRPSNNFGVVVTPAQNAMGSWAQLFTGATVARDVFGIALGFNSGTTAASARDILADIGVDPAGGTSYTTLIPTLLASGSGTWGAVGGGFVYYFPLWIRAGSSIAVRGSVNNATVGTFRAICSVHGSPRSRERVRVGRSVVAYGVTTGSSAGTAITPGTTSEGAWTSLGTTSAAHWWWQLGMGVNNAAMAQLIYHWDLGLGDATNKYSPIVDQAVGTTAANAVLTNGATIHADFDAPAGTEVWLRAQCSGTPDTGISGAAYGVRGF